MPFKSRSQQKWMFAAESRGELPKGTAHEWAAATPNIKKLPEHVKKAFAIGFEKVALNLPEQALTESGVPMQDKVPGGEARASMETGQRRKGMTRTFNVRNENKEFGEQFKVKYDTSRSKAR